MTFNISLKLSIVENPQMHRTKTRKFCRISSPQFAMLLMLTLSQPLRADWQDDISAQLLQQWRQIAGEEADASISFPGISSQYQLPACQQDLGLQTGKPLQPGRNSLEIRCATPWWQQFVAIQLHSWKSVAILTRAANADETLTPDLINWVRQDVGELNFGFFSAPDQLEGQTLKRNLRAGTVLSPDLLQPALLIQRGDKVRISLRRGPIQLQTDGTAQQDGRHGERIRVRNSQSGKTLSALVVASGEVEIR